MVDVSAEPYSSSALQTYVDDGHSVFINMTADWCITCKVTEKRLLTTERVDQLFETHNVVRMTGDWTRYDSSITEYLNAFDRVGVPLYVVNHPGMKPIVLSQFPSFEGSWCRRLLQNFLPNLVNDVSCAPIFNTLNGLNGFPRTH